MEMKHPWQKAVMEAIEKELQIHVLLWSIDSIMNPNKFLHTVVYKVHPDFNVGVILHTRAEHVFCLLLVA